MKTNKKSHTLRTKALVILMLIINAPSIRAQMQIQTWTGPDSTITLDYQDSLALVAKGQSVLQVWNTNTNQMVIQTPPVANYIATATGGNIFRKGDSILIAVKIYLNKTITAFVYEPISGLSAPFGYSLPLGATGYCCSEFPLMRKTSTGISFLSQYEIGGLVSREIGNITLGGITVGNPASWGGTFPTDVGFSSDDLHHFYLRNLSGGGFEVVCTQNSLAQNTIWADTVYTGSTLQEFMHTGSSLVLLAKNTLSDTVYKTLLDIPTGAMLSFTSIGLNQIISPYSGLDQTGVLGDSLILIDGKKIATYSGGSITDSVLFSGPYLNQKVVMLPASRMIWGGNPLTSTNTVMKFYDVDVTTLSIVDSMVINIDDYQKATGKTLQMQTAVFWGSGVKANISRAKVWFLTPASLTLGFEEDSTSQNNLLASEVLVYPNPTYGNVHIKTNRGFKILDCLGNVLREQPIVHAETTTVDMSWYSPGIYYVVLDQETIKIVNK